MKSIGQLERRKVWLEGQLVKVDAELAARKPKPKKRKPAPGALEPPEPVETPALETPETPAQTED